MLTTHCFLDALIISLQIMDAESPCTDSGTHDRVLTSRTHQPKASPISTLAPELLLKIFHLTLPTHRLPALVASDAPLLLTLVCSLWRTLAISVPELWTGAHILLGDFRMSSMEGVDAENEEAALAQEDEARLPFIQEWFKRSAGMGLKLSLTDETFFANADSIIVEYILTQLDRVEELDLLVCRRTLPRFTGLAVPHAYSKLRKLRIVGDGLDPEEWSFIKYDAPGLQEFALKMLSGHVGELALPWEGLKSLTVCYFPEPSHRPTVDELLEVLESAPALEYLRMVVRGDLGTSRARAGARRVQLLRMRTLRLAYERDLGRLWIGPNA